MNDQSSRETVYFKKAACAQTRRGLCPWTPTSSSRAPYLSLPAKAESLLIPPLLLSQRGPLHWARVGPPEKAGENFLISRNTWFSTH